MSVHFKLVYENHGNFGVHVADFFIYFKHALESQGHVADIEYSFAPGYMNVMLECFNDSVTDKIELSWSEGTGLIIVATEFLTGTTFNDIYQDDESVRLASDQNQQRDYWLMRYKNFNRLLPRCTAVWHVAEQQMEIYKAAFPEVLVDYLPHGYTDKFATVKHRPDHAKDIDVLFTGTMTAYRQMILKGLSAAGLKVWTSKMCTAHFNRDDLIARSKVVVNIKQHPDWRHESVTRLYYHVSNDSFILTEPCEFPSDLTDYAYKTMGTFDESVHEQLRLGDFTERAAIQRRRFAEELPVEEVIAPLLRRCGLQ